jgi:hypothetical protein
MRYCSICKKYREKPTWYINCWAERRGLTDARELLETRAVFLDEKKRGVV